MIKALLESIKDEVIQDEQDSMITERIESDEIRDLYLSMEEDVVQNTDEESPDTVEDLEKSIKS